LILATATAERVLTGERTKSLEFRSALGAVPDMGHCIVPIISVAIDPTPT
jgi:hypothetical protein